MDELNLFNYTDYRKYIHDYLTFNTHIKTWQDYSDFLGMPYNSFLIDIKNGNKNLSEKYVHKFADRYNFDFDEHNYWRALVGENDSPCELGKTFYRSMMDMVKSAVTV